MHSNRVNYIYACIETKRTYLMQGRSWCSSIYFQAQPGYWLKPVTGSGVGMKLVGGVDRDETTGLIVRLLLRLIPVPMEEKQKLHRLRRRNWRWNQGTHAMVKACWLVSLCFRLFIFFPSARPSSHSRPSCLY